MIRPRRWPPWASSRSAARGLPPIPARPAGDHPEHRAGRRPGASSMIRPRRWTPCVSSPAAARDPAAGTGPAGGHPGHRASRRPGAPPQALARPAGDHPEHRAGRHPGASSMIRPRRWSPWAPSRSAARGPAAGTSPPGAAHQIHPPRR